MLRRLIRKFLPGKPHQIWVLRDLAHADRRIGLAESRDRFFVVSRCVLADSTKLRGVLNHEYGYVNFRPMRQDFMRMVDCEGGHYRQEAGKDLLILSALRRPI